MEYHKGLLGKLQRLLAVGEQGARNFLKAVGSTVLQNLTNIFPVMLVYLLIVYTMGSSDLEASTVYTVVALAIALIIVMAWCASRQYKSTFSAVYAESANMRIALAEHLRRLPLAFFDHKNSSDLTARIMGDVALLENGYSHYIPQLVGAFAMLLLAMVGLLAMDWRLGLALTWVVPLSLILLLLSTRWQKRVMLKTNAVQLDMNEKIEEGLTQVQTIKAMSQEARYLRELEQQLQAMERAQMHMELFAGSIINAIQTLVRLALPTLALIASLLYLQGQVSSPIVLFYLLIASSVFEPLSAVLMNSAVWTYYTTKVDRMNEIYDMPLQQGREHFSTSRYDITFDHVDFSYGPQTQVLHDVSFTAPQGQTTALIGPSGGGKTTCAKLAARFWDPDAGRIMLGDLDLKTLDPEALLGAYAIVFQDVVLFNATVSDNIRFGRKEATEQDIQRAARLAQCEEFVRRLPQGYQTMIGENGARLSGGERQRISIARAILKDAPIVIMDEATASQDAENESLIQEALSTLIRNKTVLIIAHRMRTIAHVDHVVVLEGGRVVEQGSPMQLQASGGYYARALQAQQGNA